MQAPLAAVPEEAIRSVRLVRRLFGDGLVAAYLHGSAVSGALRPNSDVDVIVVLDREMTQAERTWLVPELMGLSSPPGAEGPRPLELIAFLRSDLCPAPYPARAHFVYGEWLREAFEAGEVPEPASDPEFTLLLAQGRQEAQPLLGPALEQLLAPIPGADIRRAIADALPALLGSLTGDERNVLLTLARMWRTLETGRFVLKDVAAEWAAARLFADEAALLLHARDGYKGTVVDDWTGNGRETRRLADELSRRITAVA